MDNVIAFPLPPSLQDELHAAVDVCQAVMVIGYDPDAELMVRSTGMTRQDALWLVECAREWVLNGGSDD